jgi:histidinol-phosphate phosphatase family protein
VDQLKLIPAAAEGIRLLNQRGIKVIVVTNQPVVARGLCSENDIAEIHSALQEMLRSEGAMVDAIYYCPHHENADLPTYRKDCPDRKPAPGMLEQGARRFNLDLRDCFMIGDRTVDIQAGRNAGCQTILVRTGFGGNDGKHDVHPDFVCDNLAEAARLVVGLLASHVSQGV